MKVIVRLADKKDLENVLFIFKSAIELMEIQNIPQWDEVYPNETVLKKDILKKQLYIMNIDEEIASVFVLNKECDNEYKNGNWEFPNAEYIVVHRLCVNPEFQNQGIGKLTMQFAEKIAKDMGAETIRLDCFMKNPFAFSMYRKLGYKVTGYADWRKGRFYLMEKLIC